MTTNEEDDMSATLTKDEQATFPPEGESAVDETETDAGTSAADRAAEEVALGQEDDGQLFIMENDKKVKLGSLLKRGVPVEYRFKLGGMGVKGKGEMGLIGFSEPNITLVVPALAGKVTVEPTYNDDQEVIKIVITAAVKPKMVYDAKSPEARDLLGL